MKLFIKKYSRSVFLFSLALLALAFAVKDSSKNTRSEISFDFQVDIITAAVCAVPGIILIIRRKILERKAHEAAEQARIMEEERKRESNPVYRSVRSAPRAAAEENTEETPDIESIAGMADKNVPPLPVLSFDIRKEKCGLSDSKLGGTPYFPRNTAYPQGMGEYEGKPLRLLVQLNFEELPPVEGFPRKGILQIFIADGEDSFGYGEPLTVQNGFRVIYHENILKDMGEVLSDEEIGSLLSGGHKRAEDFPLQGEFRLIPKENGKMPASAADFRFEKAFKDAYHARTGQSITHLWEIGDEEAQKLFERNSGYTAYMGGYPRFSQNDPRSESNGLAKYDRVLFMLDSIESTSDSGYDVLWGDMGTGCFMIPGTALAKGDFSQVLYNFDCG